MKTITVYARALSSISQYIDERFDAILMLCLLVICAGYLVLTPPFQAPDERNHFARAYHLADGKIIGRLSGPSGKMSGDNLPKILKTDIHLFDELMYHPERKISGLQWLKRVGASHSLTRENIRVKEFIEFPNTVLYPPVSYMPQVCSILLARALGLKTILTLYLARIFNLIASLCLIYVALRQLDFSRRMKMVLFCLAGLPMTVFLIASASQDAVTIALAFVVVSLGFRLDRSWDNRRFAIFLFATLLLSLSKVPYALVSWMAIPSILEQAQPGKVKLRNIVLLIACSSAPSVLWQICVDPLIVSFKPDTDMRAQLSFFLQHPLRLMWVFTQKLIEQKFYVSSFVGHLGWLDTFIGRKTCGLYLCFLLLCCFTARRSDEANEGSKISRLVINIAIFMSIAYLICLSMYLTWTHLHVFDLGVVQGRYFIPASGLVFLALPVLYRYKNHHYNLFVAAVLAAWLALSCRVFWILYARYWM